MVARTIDKTRYWNLRFGVWNSTTGTKYKQTSAVKKLLRTRTGSGLPHYKELIAKHESATTGLTARYQSLDTSGAIEGSVRYFWDPSGGWASKTPQWEYLSGDVLGYQQITSGAVSNWPGNGAQGRAANKFLSEVRETQSRFSAPTFLGELRQTLRMMHRPAGALWKNLLGYEAALSKRKRQNPKRWIYSIPELWLEWSFGWKPLMMDIDEAWKAANSLLDEEHVQNCQGSAMDTQQISASASTYLPPGSNYCQCKFNTLAKENVLYRYRGDVVVQAATTCADRFARWGFNPDEFLPTAWELLPWSFLVDYFATIGDFIDASGARTAGLKWTNLTLRRKYTKVVTGYFNAEYSKSTIPAANYILSANLDKSPAMSIYVDKEVTRSAVSPSSISAALSIRWDGPRWGQIANMSALLGMFNSNLHFQQPSLRNFRR